MTRSRAPSERLSTVAGVSSAPTQRRAIGAGAASRATPTSARPAPNAIAKVDGRIAQP